MNGVDVDTAEPREILALRKAVLGYVSQFLRVVPRVPTLDVVAEPLLAVGVDADTACEPARDLLARLSIAERLWSLSPTPFSSGEQQRVNIARGFAHSYPTMLLDKPTASLDAANSETVFTLIEEAKALGAKEIEFDSLVANDAFQLLWAAHGLRYGVPRAAIGNSDAPIVLVNLSRRVLGQARAAFEEFTVLSLTAKSETLAARLAARGRKTPAGIVSRLERAASLRPQGEDVIEVTNDGPLGVTVQCAIAALQPVRA